MTGVRVCFPHGSDVGLYSAFGSFASIANTSTCTFDSSLFGLLLVVCPGANIRPLKPWAGYVRVVYHYFELIYMRFTHLLAY